jgi:uncharacterized protein YfkK (UPF0435 family)
MEMLMLVLLGFSLLLLLFSIFQKDPYTELKEEVDQLTLQQVQEVYQIKKKLKILEEELLVTDDFPTTVMPNIENQKDIHKIIKNQVWALAQQGKPIEQIASQSSLSVDDVYAILKEYTNRGNRNE